MSWNDLLEFVANLLQVGSVAFAVGFFFYNALRLHRRLKRLERERTSHPVALAIGLGGDIEGAVRQYLKEAGMDMPIENYYVEGFIPREKFYDILRDINRIKARLTNEGVTEVHLFYRGPVTFAMALGAVTDNWVPIKVYDYDGKYVLQVILEKETVLGL